MSIRQVGIRLKPEGGPEVVKAAKDAERALNDMNASAAAGADKATAATKRTVEALKAEAGAAKAAETALQRQINAVTGVSGGNSAVTQKYFQSESKVLDRRASALLEQLEPARAAQDRLNAELAEYDLLARRGKITTEQLASAQVMARKRFDETTHALGRQGSGLTRMQAASRLNLSRQASDVLVTGAMGMNPAMIAIQQGPQIMDAWATSGIKLSPVLIGLSAAALGVAAAVGVMAVAYYDAEKATYAYERAATGVGRTANMSAQDLRDAAEAGAEAAEISKKAAREQAIAYVSTGKIGGEVLEGLIGLSKDYASFMGIEAKDATEALAKAFSEPDKAARDMTRQFGLLDQKTLDTIDSLTKQGDRLAAQKLLLDALTGAVSGHSDKVYGLAGVWDSALRAASDYIAKVGDWMTTSPEEHIANLERQAFGNGQGRSSNFGLGADQATKAAAYAEWVMATASRGIDEMVRESQAERARENQRAQEEEDRKEKPKKKKGKSADQLERERLARERREEDVQAGLAMQLARTNEDQGEIRRLEDEEALRRRIRQLVDDGAKAEDARRKALQEQAPYLAARAEADERGRAELARSADIEAARLTGQERLLADAERQAEMEQRVAEYRRLGLGVTSEVREVVDDINGLTSEIVVTDHAILKARADMLKIDEARAAVLKRANEEAEREHKLTLARLSGNEGLYRYLDTEDRIERRARDIERRNGMNHGEGVDQAMSEIQAELDAEATGARKAWMRGLLDDIRNGGIGEAVSRQLDTATDHWMDKLAESLAELDWGGFLKDLFGGGGSGGGGWGKAFGTLFGDGGGEAGSGSDGDFWGNLFGGDGHSKGTAFSDGGWKWVGERGPELMRVPRGAEVMEHNRSMMMAGGGGSGGGLNIGTFKVVNNTSEPVEGQLRRQDNGDLELILEPAIQRGIDKAGSNGGLAKAFRRTPGVTLR